MLLEAYNANLADLEAHRGALAAGAEALIRQELITGGWVGARAVLGRLVWCLSSSSSPCIGAAPVCLSLSPPTSFVVGAPLTRPGPIPLPAGKDLEEILAAHPPVQPESVRQVTAEPLDTLLAA